MKSSILRQSPVAKRTLDTLRPRIIDRYLLREVAISFLAATAILLLVMVGGAVADLLSKIARGRMITRLDSGISPVSGTGT